MQLIMALSSVSCVMYIFLDLDWITMVKVQIVMWRIEHVHI